MEGDPGLLGLDGVDGAVAGETLAELDHALGQADLAQALVALLARDIVGGLAGAVPPPLVLGVDGGVVDDLLVDCLVCVVPSKPYAVSPACRELASLSPGLCL